MMSVLRNFEKVNRGEPMEAEASLTCRKQELAAYFFRVVYGSFAANVVFLKFCVLSLLQYINCFPKKYHREHTLSTAE